MKRLSFPVLLTACHLCFVCNSHGQTFSEEQDSIASFNYLGRYAIGLSTAFRQAAPTAGLGVEQNFWRTYGIGLSALRYTTERLYWTVGLGYMTAREDVERTRDIRLVLDPATGRYRQEELGTRTKVWKYRYFTVPIGLNYLLFNTRSTNLYVAGSVVFD